MSDPDIFEDAAADTDSSKKKLLAYAMLGKAAQEQSRELARKAAQILDEADPRMVLVADRKRRNGWRMKQRGPLSNREFAANDGHFRAACDKTGMKPTKRQASRWRMKTGKAYKEGRVA